MKTFLAKFREITDRLEKIEFSLSCKDYNDLRTYEILIEERDALAEQAEILTAYFQLFNEKQELVANVSRLKLAGSLLLEAKPYSTDGVHKAIALLEETPKQSVTAIEVQAITTYGSFLKKEIYEKLEHLSLKHWIDEKYPGHNTPAQYAHLLLAKGE